MPSKAETGTTGVPPPSSSSTSSSTQPIGSSTEFIPNIFYTLYQIQKDPNKSNNQLEMKTGFIRHRLRTCKSLIKDNEKTFELLSKSTEEWDQFICNRENELQIKKNVLLDLRAKISKTLTDSDYKPEHKKEESIEEETANHSPIENSTNDVVPEAQEKQTTADVDETRNENAEDVAKDTVEDAVEDDADDVIMEL